MLRCSIQMNRTRANGNKEDVATVCTHRQTEREIQEGTGTLATSWPLPPSSSSPSSSLSGQRASGQAAPSRPSICAPPLLPLRRRTFTIRMVLPPSLRRKIDGEQGVPFLPSVRGEREGTVAFHFVSIFLVSRHPIRDYYLRFFTRDREEEDERSFSSLFDAIGYSRGPNLPGLVYFHRYLVF